MASIILKSNVPVLVDPVNVIHENVYLKVSRFSENYEAGNYTCEGEYFYHKQNEYTLIKPFTYTLPALMVDALAAQIQVPSGTTESNRRRTLLVAGTIAIAHEDGLFGLTAQDWTLEN